MVSQSVQSWLKLLVQNDACTWARERKQPTTQTMFNIYIYIWIYIARMPIIYTGVIGVSDCGISFWVVRYGYVWLLLLCWFAVAESIAIHGRWREYIHSKKSRPQIFESRFCAFAIHVLLWKVVCVQHKLQHIATYLVLLSPRHPSTMRSGYPSLCVRH